MKDQCACCGVYGLPMKPVGLVMMCIDNLGCEQRKAARRDDSDRFLLTPLEGPPDPSLPHVTVDCSRSGCRMSFFVSKQDPRLPDGPFLCPDHSDSPVTPAKTPGHVEATVTCDRCEAVLTAKGPTRTEAIAKLRELITEQNWKVSLRLEDMMATPDSIAVTMPSTVTAPDLCGRCNTDS